MRDVRVGSKASRCVARKMLCGAFMPRARLLATLFFVIPSAGSGQAVSVLHIKVALVNAERKATPVASRSSRIWARPRTERHRRSTR